jgi:hypothetical protein
MMLFESGLQAGLPLPFQVLGMQQFCDAFTSVEAPQMLPGGLQPPPLSQVCSAASQRIAFEGSTWSLMLQQASVESQKSPVMRQPPAGWHTLAPLPGSTHRREQQLDGPAQGLPPWTQPPGGSTQRPGAPALVSHRPEQQSVPW